MVRLRFWFFVPGSSRLGSFYSARGFRRFNSTNFFTLIQRSYMFINLHLIRFLGGFLRARSIPENTKHNDDKIKESLLQARTPPISTSAYIKDTL